MTEGPDVVLVPGFLSRVKADALLERIHAESESNKTTFSYTARNRSRDWKHGTALGTTRIPMGSC